MNLNRTTAGQTDYITKLNENFSEIESSFNINDAELSAVKAAMSAGSDLDFRQNAFNYAINGAFNSWQRGTNTRPDCWNIENDGGSFSVSRSTTQTKINTYSVLCANQGRLTQEIPKELRLSLTNSFSISTGCWIYSSAANNARIGLHNGSVWQWSEYHNGDSTWQFLYKSILQGSGSVPSSIKIGLDCVSGSVYFSSAVLIKGNPGSGPAYVANNPTLEKLCVYGRIENGVAAVRGVGLLEGTDRKLIVRVPFVAPKINTPTIELLDDVETGYEITYDNEDVNGFDLHVLEVGGPSGTNGFEYLDINWRATAEE